ncbi:dTMP kinase [soil metagenome]
MFITFEGPDGAGKTTQIALLAERLNAAGWKTVTTREPGGTPIGCLIRGLLLDSEHAVSATTEAYLMTADRAEHVRHVIQPALLSKAVVISDRYLDSTLAYQGGGRGLPVEELRSLQTLATGGLEPTLTLLLDLPVEEGLERRFQDHAGNRLDRESMEFHRRVAATFHALAHADPDRWRIVDATQAIEMVHTAVWSHVVTHLESSRAALARDVNE